MFELAYDLLFKFDIWFFLKNLDLANILLLGLRGMRERILKILAYLSLVGIRVCVSFLLNWEKIHCLNIISLLLVVSLS